MPSAGRSPKLADRLITEIELDYAESKRSLPKPGTVGAPDTGVASATRPGQRKQVVIGPHTASLAAKVQAIKAALEDAGADVTVIGRSAIDDYDPEDGTPLRALLAAADVLVAPLSFEQPLQRSTVGGHTTVLSTEWAAAGKAERNVVWFRPADVEVKPQDMASERHLKCFEQLSPVCCTETALVNHLFGIGSGAAIRVHIENHPQENAFKRLSRQLEEAWAKLPPDASRPMLRCVSLDLDDLANASKDVAGVVLLLPVPLKDPRSLLAQIDQVQRFIPKIGTYPGCVAILYNPPLASQVPKHEWPYLQIKKSDEEPKLTIEDDSKLELEEFLVDLWERYRRGAAADVAGRAAGR